MLIDWFTVVAQGLNFLVLVWLLKRYLYKPVLAAIEKREKQIALVLAQAASKKAAAEQEGLAFAAKKAALDREGAAVLKRRRLQPRLSARVCWRRQAQRQMRGVPSR